MNAKKQKLVELDAQEKCRIRRVTGMIFTMTALVCLILVGCFACSHDNGSGELSPDMMTQEQLTLYWTAKIDDVRWIAEVDPSQGEKGNGKLHFSFDFPEPLGVHTKVDPVANALILYFTFDGEDLSPFELQLTGNEGSFVYDVDQYPWKVKLSEKNGSMFLTMTDAQSKTVYYDQIHAAT